MGKMQTIGIAEAQPKLAQLVNEVGEGGQPYFLVVNGKVKAALVGINQYNGMVEQLEDWSTPTGTSVVP